jgi:hypothetical protein
MEEHYTTERLLTLRKLTRATADLLRAQMKEYLSTLAPLFRPKMVFGNYVEGESYESSRLGEKAYTELRELYENIAQSRQYNLPRELKTPLEVISSQLEMTPVEYKHTASSEKQNKTVLVTSPLKWALSYAGFSPTRLRALLADRSRKGDDLQQCLLHSLMMHSVITKQTGLNQILEALHFPLSVERSAEFGDLPICYISSSISTIRLPDAVIIESTEISGMDAFEEVVNVADVARLRDPLKERLLPLIEDGAQPSG